MNIKRIIFLAIFFLLLSSKNIYADSEYVLPYPSVMPGSIFYKLNLIKESMQKFWYFGDFGQFTYNLKNSDKYLVESKTLFEYKQHLLAIAALKKSDNYFDQTFKFLNSARKASKNIEKNRKILSEAALKHIEILERLEAELPESVVWSPENDNPEVLLIGEQIENSKRIREKFL